MRTSAQLIMNSLTATDWLAIALGLAAIAAVNWYFFFASQPAAHATLGTSGQQEVTVIVRGGYDPSTIRVKAGSAVRLRFDRQETSSCSEEIVFPDFGLKKFLPAHQQTIVELTPPRAGTYEFTCGMGMLHGRLIAE